ncbi:ABC transporter ATP-binding protein [Niveibacterium umoris]|uniref:Iron complex transport system ATP-binding protein n=1 Tax=Niveibacterium umoris TaxID=1193620 RepID=A0A840BMB2_9RHOO|nr:ABC transporter ATP-binding protein [Niveibacterium umoris]MBB4014355.1 iron complex transport system ATP-binding protein [Niveibacterium umoris]
MSVGVPPPLLHVRGLDVRVADVCAVRALEIDLMAGQRLAILGRNGVGKSTLLAALAGLHASQGVLECGGRAIADWPARALARLRGWLPQHAEDPFASSVEEAVLVGRHPWLERFEWEGEDDLRVAAAALSAMGLQGFAQRNVQTLSGGERQRVAIAALLAQTPQLYLLDEPLTHLDLAGQISVLDHFRSVTEAGAAVAMVLHDINLALRWASHVLILFGAGEWCAGPAEEMASAELFGRALGYPLRALRDGSHVHFVPG